MANHKTACLLHLFHHGGYDYLSFLRFGCYFLYNFHDLTLNFFIVDIDIYQEDSEDPQDDGKCICSTPVMVFMASFCFCERRNGYCVLLLFQFFLDIYRHGSDLQKIVLRALNVRESLGIRLVDGYSLPGLKHAIGIGSWLT